MLADSPSTTNGVDAATAPGVTSVSNGALEDEDPSQRWRSLEKLVSRPSPYGAETGALAVGEFEPFENVSNGRPAGRQEEEAGTDGF